MTDSGVAHIVTGLVTITTMVVGFLTLWIKLRYGVEKTEEGVKKTEEVASKAQDVEDKIVVNTKLTKAGVVAAAQNAKAAVAAVKENKNALAEGLNGVMGVAIEEHVAPLRAKMDVIESYVHQRNHDLLSALQVMANKIEVVLKKLEEKQP